MCHNKYIVRDEKVTRWWQKFCNDGESRVEKNEVLSPLNYTELKFKGIIEKCHLNYAI